MMEGIWVKGEGDLTIFGIQGKKRTENLLRKKIEEIFQSYYPTLVRAAYGYIKDWQKAEDIVQDTFVKALRNLDHLQPQDAVIKKWLMTAMVRTAIDYLRKARDYPSEIEMLDMALFEQDNPVEQKVIFHLWRQELELSLQELPVHYQQIMVLYYHHDMKIKDIADTLGINPNTVRSCLHRSRNHLYQKMMQIEMEEAEAYEEKHTR